MRISTTTSRCSANTRSSAFIMNTSPTAARTRKSAREALGKSADYIVAASWWSQLIPNEAVRAFDAKWAKAYPKLNAEWYSALPMRRRARSTSR